MGIFAFKDDAKSAFDGPRNNKAAHEGHSWLSWLGGHGPAAAPAAPETSAAPSLSGSLASGATNSLSSMWADLWKSDKKDEKPAEPPPDPAKLAEEAKKAQERQQQQQDDRERDNRGTQRDRYQPIARGEAQKDYKEAQEAFDKKTPAKQKTSKAPTPVTETEVMERVHGKMLHDEYNGTDAKDRLVKDPKASAGDLNTEEGKRAFLQNFTQQDSANPGRKENEDYCGPTAMIAAAVFMKGPKGVTPLISQMQHDAKVTFNGDKKKIAEFNASMKGIQERADKGELTNGDMDTLKEQLYGSMHRQQEKDQSIDPEDRKKAGINERIMKDYLDMTGLNDDMAAQHLDIRNVDNDGDGTRNHYILRMFGDKEKGIKPAVFDPYSRKGGQLVTKADQIGDYDQTRYATLHHEETG